MFTEYVEGKKLDDINFGFDGENNNKVMDMCRNIAMKVTQCITYLHNQNVLLFTGIKPETVLVSLDFKVVRL